MTDVIPQPPTHFGPPPAERTPEGRLLYRDVVYAAVPGFRHLLLDLTVPPAEQPVPLVVWLHGGAWRHGSHKPVGALPWLGRLTERVLASGLALAAVQYRLSGETPFPGQLHDVKAAIRWLRAFGGRLGVDPDRIGVWGESAGGHLAALAALTGDNPADAATEGAQGVVGVDSRVRAGVDFYGPADLLRLGEQSGDTAPIDHDAADSPESLLVGGPVQDDRAAAAFAGPITHVHAQAPPLLIVHGERDRLVPCAQSRDLAAALVGVGAPVEFVPVPGADHVLAGVDPDPVVDLAVDFLARALRA